MLSQISEKQGITKDNQSSLVDCRNIRKLLCCLQLYSYIITLYATAVSACSHTFFKCEEYGARKRRSFPYISIIVQYLQSLDLIENIIFKSVHIQKIYFTWNFSHTSFKMNCRKVCFFSNAKVDKSLSFSEKLKSFVIFS